jgi:hypothetical protein
VLVEALKHHLDFRLKFVPFIVKTYYLLSFAGPLETHQKTAGKRRKNHPLLHERRILRKLGFVENGKLRPEKRDLLDQIEIATRRVFHGCQEAPVRPTITYDSTPCRQPTPSCPDGNLRVCDRQGKFSILDECHRQADHGMT